MPILNISAAHLNAATYDWPSLNLIVSLGDSMVSLNGLYLVSDSTVLTWTIVAFMV